MQPCPVCGNTGIDANGYCTTCSTYLGTPQQGYPGQPQYGAAYPGQPVSGPGNAPTTPYPAQPPAGPAPTTPYPVYPPSSSVPYSGAPASAPGYGPASSPPAYTPGYASGAPAGYGPPASAPPGFSGPGYGYPTAPPEPPKKSYTGAIVAACLGLVVLVAAIVVVFVVKSHKDTPVAQPTRQPTAGPSAHPSASASVNAKGIDTCVIGSWKVISEQLKDDFPDIDDVPLSLKNNYKMTLTADGTATEDYEAYGDETDYFADYQGHTYQLAFDGTLTYNFTTSSGTLSATKSITNGRYGKWKDGKSIDSGSNDFDDYDWSYSCSGDTMTRQLSNDTQRLTRL